MRIGINALLLGRFDSGVEIYIRSLIHALARLDARNEYVIYLTRDADPPDIANNPRFQLRRVWFRSGSRATRILWEQCRMARSLAREQIDIFHSPGYVMPVLCSLPTVVTMHDVIALKFPHLCKMSNVAHYRLLIPYAVRHARRIVASSQATKEDILGLFAIPPEKVEVIYPGVDEAFFKQEDAGAEVRSKYALPGKYILFVGNIEPKKNLAALIEAYYFLREKRDIRIPLLVIGKKGWKYGPVLEAVNSFGLADHVLFRGYVDRSDLPAIFKMAEVFVFPSIAEGFGLPPLEAMASGTPVVTSSAPAIPEVVGDAAIAVPADSPKLLALAICKVLENTFLRKTLIARGRERAKLFSWENTAKQMLRVYAELGEAKKA